MLNRWINRLVRSEERRRKLLRKPKITWPSLLQTSAYGKLDAISRQSFPERIQLYIELKPTLIANKEITATVNLDAHKCLSTPIYQNLNGNHQRMYGRCSSIDLVIKNWHAMDSENTGIELTKHCNQILYTKDYFTCSTCIVDQQTVENHRIVNATSKRKHIYPYGGYLSVDGTVGDALYMTLSSDITQTKINIHTYQELLDQHINLFDSNSIYASQSMDSSERNKILPLQHLIEHGDIDCELTTKTVDNTWAQSYQSESFVRKDGTYEGVLTMRRKGNPNLRSIA